jgi:diaminohydroxyphosphoribosylaminopyrimidine deaminase / 5-amino-6-(5-phosphoribosylamino)uracil reductase
VTEDDKQHMARALKLAEGAKGQTYPNPTVGCVITNNGVVVGEGYHPRHGAPHAEIFALRAAGQRARGGTAYVTLEPCNHYGRTPPCALAVIEAGIKRVWVMKLLSMLPWCTQVEGNGELLTGQEK